MEVTINKIIEDILNRKINLALRNFNTMIHKYNVHREFILHLFTTKTFSFMKSLIIQQRYFKGTRGSINKDNLSTFLELHKSISRLEIAYCHIMNIYDSKKQNEYKSDNFPIKTKIEQTLDSQNMLVIQ